MSPERDRLRGLPSSAADISASSCILNTQTASIISKFVCGFCSRDEHSCSAKHAGVTEQQVTMMPRGMLFRAPSMNFAFTSVNADAMASPSDPSCAAAARSSDIRTLSDGSSSAPRDSSKRWRSPGGHAKGLAAASSDRVPLPVRAAVLAARDAGRVDTDPRPQWQTGQPERSSNGSRDAVRRVGTTDRDYCRRPRRTDVHAACPQGCIYSTPIGVFQETRRLVKVCPARGIQVGNRGHAKAFGLCVVKEAANVVRPAQRRCTLLAQDAAAHAAAVVRAADGESEVRHEIQNGPSDDHLQKTAGTRLDCAPQGAAENDGRHADGHHDVLLAKRHLRKEMKVRGRTPARAQIRRRRQPRAACDRRPRPPRSSPQRCLHGHEHEHEHKLVQHDAHKHKHERTPRDAHEHDNELAQHDVHNHEHECAQPDIHHDGRKQEDERKCEYEEERKHERKGEHEEERKHKGEGESARNILRHDDEDEDAHDDEHKREHKREQKCDHQELRKHNREGEHEEDRKQKRESEHDDEHDEEHDEEHDDSQKREPKCEKHSNQYREHELALVSALLCSGTAPAGTTPNTIVSPEETTATSSTSTSASTIASMRTGTVTGTGMGTGMGTDGSPSRSGTRNASRRASSSESRGSRSPRASSLATAPTQTTSFTRPSTTNADTNRTTMHDDTLGGREMPMRRLRGKQSLWEQSPESHQSAPVLVTGSKNNYFATRVQQETAEAQPTAIFHLPPLPVGHHCLVAAAGIAPPLLAPLPPPARCQLLHADAASLLPPLPLAHTPPTADHSLLLRSSAAIELALCDFQRVDTEQTKAESVSFANSTIVSTPSSSPDRSEKKTWDVRLPRRHIAQPIFLKPRTLMNNTLS
ncbi:LOW QUALITY PROTEIN: hypothetical protein BU14_0196s0009 [Porphyra umbilicalis]|uniref:Uncharacterized protein n=1 Tax=Porphyra umbilicalis TaxID=2786 RepID=A0A1X6P627_PORUM|nr:LOW QUALITY PROTEIN: hypothetical protein BU14_0196s0009 [Porphyra umbilicalis]|eukprot:OSX76342.1 LOW QUALITY PROTEIN: hypothetical protein BU14_0196s0009 [Porphyra umbilicalis]